MNKKVIPINRASKFYGWEDYNLEVTIGREYIESEIDFRVVFYSIYN